MPFGRWIWLMLAVCVAASPAFAAGGRRANREYGFSVDFPPGLAICPNGSWRHAHGWGAALDGRCDPAARTDENRRAIGVVGDYNLDSRTPADAAGVLESRL